MDTDRLARLDSFPYRHRCAEIMSSPVATVSPDATLEEAVRLMVERNVSSLVSLHEDRRADGIITEKDILRAMAAHGAQAGSHRVSEYLTRPVPFVRANAFVYMALGRMARLNVKHLVCIDGEERVVGIITARALLKLRSAETLQIGDQVRAAADAAELAAAREQLPSLAQHLLAEDVSAPQVAAVISAVYCDMTRRAAQLAAEGMERDGWGAQPAAWSVLVLGSAGRGESLLAPDQDNAIVHAGTEDDDAWFAEAGRRIADMLDAAGVPYCKGGVMASRPDWRHSMDGWRARIDHWVRHPAPDNILMVDIFYDFIPVYGDVGLAADLRRYAMDKALRAIPFLKVLGQQMDEFNPPLGFLGRFRTEQGRLDLKKGGLLPLVRGARVMALQQGVEQTSTRDRLDAVHREQVLHDADHRALLDAHDVLMSVVLRQQIDDIRRGREPSSRVDPARFSADEAAKVKDAVRQCDALKLLVRDSLSHVPLPVA